MQTMDLDYFGYKIYQSDLIGMKLKLDVSCHVPNFFTKLQIDISKLVEKTSGKLGRTNNWTDTDLA